MRALLLESSICKKPSASQSTSTACYSSRKCISWIWIAKEPWNTEKEGTLWRQVPLYVRPLHRPTVFHWAIKLNQVSLGPLLLPHKPLSAFTGSFKFPTYNIPNFRSEEKASVHPWGRDTLGTPGWAWHNIWLAPCKGMHISGSEKFLLVKSGILRTGIRNTAHGIRNPTKDWNSESKFH